MKDVDDDDDDRIADRIIYPTEATILRVDDTGQDEGGLFRQTRLGVVQ